MHAAVYIGQNIKNLRQMYNMSQEDLANKLNINVELLKTWEEENNFPNAWQLSRVVRVFQVKADDLYAEPKEAAEPAAATSSESNKASAYRTFDKIITDSVKQDTAASGKSAEENPHSFSSSDFENLVLKTSPDADIHLKLVGKTVNSSKVVFQTTDSALNLDIMTAGNGSQAENGSQDDNCNSENLESYKLTVELPQSIKSPNISN